MRDAVLYLWTLLLLIFGTPLPVKGWMRTTSIVKSRHQRSFLSLLGINRCPHSSLYGPYHNVVTPYSTSIIVLTRLRMAQKVTIRMVGRSRGGTIRSSSGGGSSSDTWIEDGCDMYRTRLLSSGIPIETVWYKTDEALVKAVANLDYKKAMTSNSKSKRLSVVSSNNASQSVVIFLDLHGKTYTSEQFAHQFYQWMEAGGSRVTFVIGGAEGLPSELLCYDFAMRQPISFRLSNLTLTHQFARLLLLEQIYRASEIRKGSGYHK